MKYIFIGSFPPPYGGVTKKNVMLFEALKERIYIERATGYGKVALLQQVLSLFRPGVGFVIGIGSMKRLKQYLQIMNSINRKALCNTIVMVPGGVFHQYVRDAGSRYINILKKVRVLYVETDGMRKELELIGIDNVKVFPNCRNGQYIFMPRKNQKEKLKCIFFSMVSNGKGIDVYLDAAKELSEIQFDIYGELNMNQEEIDNFLNICNMLNNVQYKGCFKGPEEKVYELLNQYDVLVLPSRWKFEGVPGVLVESKIAALPSIVSSINFNSEVIRDGREGIVLQNNTSECLCEVLRSLDMDRELLFSLAKGAKASAKRYYLSNYIDDLLLSFK